MDGFATLTLGMSAVLATVILWSQLGLQRFTVLVTAVAAGLTPLVSLRLGGDLTLGDAALFGATCLAFLGWLGHDPVEPNRYLRRILAAVALTASGGFFAGAMVEIQPADATSNLTAYLAATLLPILLVTLLRPSAAHLRTILTGYGTGVVISVGDAFLNQSSTIYRPTGFTPTANHLGLTCLLGFAAWAAVFVGTGRRRVQVVSAAGAVVCLYGINLSGSRANLAGAAFAVLVMILVRASRKLTVLAVLGGAGLFFAILTGRVQASATSGLSRLLGLGDGATTAQAADAERDYLYTVTADRIREHPLAGSGWGDALQGHDLYRQMYAIAGVAGAVAIAILVFGVALPALRSARMDGNRTAGVLWAGYAGYLVAGLRSNQMWDRYIWVFLTLAAVASVVSWRRELDDGADLPVSAPRDTAASTSY